MRENYLEFSLSDEKELKAFAILIAQLNKEGIPYTVRKDSIAIQLRISSGY